MNSKYLVIDNIYGKVVGGANTLAEAHEAADRSMHIHTSVVCEIRR